MKVIIQYVDMEIMCDAQIKKKKRNIHSQIFWCYLKWNKTEGDLVWTLSVLCDQTWIVCSEGYDRLAKQEQNNAIVFGFYVLVLLNEIRAALLCHDTQPKVCKYMKESQKTNQNAVCKYEVLNPVLSVFGQW